MIDWIFEGIANWVASIMTQVMDAVSGVFLEALGTDMTAMEEYFPFVTAAYSIMQYTAWALLFLIVVWQLFRTFGGPITEAEHPFELLARGALFAFLITYAKPIFSLVLEIARAPYTALMESSLDPGDFTFAGIEQALTSGLTTIVSVATVVGLILLIVMMIALGWNYFKLLLETVERYVLVGVLCYTSPLAYAMGASKSTSRVFQSWCRMIGSQLLLLVLNVWFLRAFNSSVGHFVANGGALTSGQGNIFLWIFCALALLKIAQRADSYLAAMGLSVAQTGSSMGMEMLMAARLITGLGHGGSHNAGSTFTSAARGAATGTAAGAAGGFMSGFTTRYSPNSFVRDAVVEGGSRMGAGGSVGFVGRTFGGMAARNGATLNCTSIASVATRPNNVSGTIAGNIADRSIGNFMPHLASGTVPGGAQLSGTEIRGGHIQTTATMPDGSKAAVDLYHAGQFNSPDAPIQPSQPQMAASGIRQLPVMQWAPSTQRPPLPATPLKQGKWQKPSPECRKAPCCVRWMTVFWKQVTRMAAVPSCIAVPIIRSPPLPMSWCRAQTARVGTPCPHKLQSRSLRMVLGTRPIIRHCSGSLCPASTSPSSPSTPPEPATACWRSGTRMVLVPRSMTAPCIRPPEATISCCRILMADSGMPSAARLLWSSGRSIRMVNPSMMGTISEPIRWRVFAIRLRPLHTGRPTAAALSRSGGPVRKHNCSREPVEGNLLCLHRFSALEER